MPEVLKHMHPVKGLSAGRQDMTQGPQEGQATDPAVHRKPSLEGRGAQRLIPLDLQQRVALA